MGESKVYDFTNDTVEVNNEAQTTGTEADVENNQTQELNNFSIIIKYSW